jgi:hypothetical protein
MEDSEDRFYRLLCHQSRQSNVPSTGKRNTKGVCNVVWVVKRPYRKDENTRVLELKVIVTLLALYSKCSMLCAQTLKHPIVRIAVVFLSIEENTIGYKRRSSHSTLNKTRSFGALTDKSRDKL